MNLKGIVKIAVFSVIGFVLTMGLGFIFILLRSRNITKLCFGQKNLSIFLVSFSIPH